MTPPALAIIERRRRALERADNAYRAALVDAIDAGHTYRAVTAHARLSVGRVHEIVAVERLRREAVARAELNRPE